MTYGRGYGESEVYLLSYATGVCHDMISDTERFGVYEIDTQGFAFIFAFICFGAWMETKGRSMEMEHSIALYPGTDRRSHLHLHQVYLVSLAR